MRVGYIATQIREVRRAIRELLKGAASATVSSPAGSQSYTRPQLKDLMEYERQLRRDLSMAKVRKRTQPDFSE